MRNLLLTSILFFWLFSFSGNSYLTYGQDSIPGKQTMDCIDSFSIIFRVQVIAFNSLLQDEAVAKRLTKEVGPFYLSVNKGKYRYSVGHFTSYKQALAYREYVKRRGVVKAPLVVAFRLGTQISLSEAGVLAK